MHQLSTVLLVEDNDDDAELIAYAFEKAGIANPLVRLADGEAAVAYARGTGVYADRDRHPVPALILLDLKLPRRSGFEVLAEVRANPSTQHTPVVVLTSSGQQPDIERAYQLCANSYLVKPVNRDALLDMVKALDAYWVRLNRTVSA
ncbi:response regulator [Sphingomonas aerophila]|jgi:CheY-like chemotaxis protein|uniref:CheY-like chemotaxis protein n=1 Tax=Sphingomonas aerophila TaxID=1344948 RepID=A0A7W9BGW5_9SPHN|nr:response regulator [Sphingomonas aerophila]MBB5717015.1 CheY-like chemotaxis protein [Sphingomonas aerophila]